MKGDYCGLNEFKPNQRTLDAINDMNDITDMSRVLRGVLSAVPAFQIFVGKKSYSWFSTASSAKDIYSYDWEQFHQAMKSVDKVEREQLNRIATTTAMYSKGDDYRFWKCVQNAL
ncbi:hypothetical protein ACFODT_03070 [Vibrio zhugei]|uniref:Uncharacterized protein n=1 Tax=Vibrio zhugei TaxID=2479546 RepID=A0ABV7C5B9_9VIBR|nr:hypothetical protein [Vibrio zhugei]